MNGSEGLFLHSSVIADWQSVQFSHCYTSCFRSLGVLLYTLVYGAMPFDGSNFKRLVKQISQGDYFEPKKPSRKYISILLVSHIIGLCERLIKSFIAAASPLIRDMLTVSPAKRADLVKICSHWWVNEGQSESCLDIAEHLANQTPVRLDLLLSLAPPVSADQVVVTSDQVRSLYFLQ